jgi:hypothetical protein
MKKIYTTILSVAIATTVANAQCILGENFTTFTGSSAAMPAGWIGLNMSATAASNIYTSAGSCGPSGANAFKFGTNKETLITPIFTVSSYDSVSFWIKGNSLDTISNLKVYVGTDTVTANMFLVDTYKKTNVAVAGEFKSFFTYSTDKYIKFVYTKVAGNFGFDDFCISTPGVTSIKLNNARTASLSVSLVINKLVVNANATVTLHNIIGQKVMTSSVAANETVDLSNINAGIYIVNAVSGTNRTTKKIVIE